MWSKCRCDNTIVRAAAVSRPSEPAGSSGGSDQVMSPPLRENQSASNPVSTSTTSSP